MSERAWSAAVVLSAVAVSTLGSCGQGSSSPSPVATATPTPTPAPLTPITPVGPQPGPGPSPTAPTPTPTGTPAPITITIVGINGGMSFAPSPAHVRVGQQIVWHNADMATAPGHTASNHGTGAFNTGLIAPGGTSGPIVPSTAGTFNYVCDIHPTMVGILEVTP